MIASPAHAVTRYTYNPGGHKGDPIKIVKEGKHGTFFEPMQSRSQFTVVFEDGCIRVLKVTTPVMKSITYSWGTVVDTDYLYGEPTTEVLVEFCQ